MPPMRALQATFGAVLIFLVSIPDSGRAQVWFQTTAPSNNWSSVACSADGSRLVAASGNGFIYTSMDYGSTWVSNSAPGSNWTAVASSANGTMLAASGSYGIFTNSGTTWNEAFSEPYQGFTILASSADGTKLLTAGSIVDLHGVPALFVSTNVGVTWSNTDNSSFSQPWVAVASSADGNVLVAAVQNEFTFLTNGAVYISTNAGAAWMTNNAPTQVFYTSLSCSTNGSEVLAATSGGLFMTTNAGSSWTILSNAPPLSQIACSANGCVLFGLGSNWIYSSVDAGADWTTNDAPLANWAAIAISADGSHAAAAVSGGGIYVLQPLPQLNLTSSSNNMTAYWPTGYVGFGLQQTTNLSAPNWLAITNVPTASNGLYQITLPATNTQLFLRLKSS